MAELSGREPLLFNAETDHGFSKRDSFLLCLVKWVLKFLMWAIFVSWAAVIFLYPSEFMQGLSRKWILGTRDTIFGVTGSVFLIFSSPILVIALLAFAYVTAFPKEYGIKKSKYASFRLWTFPILVDGPFGVVSAAELIGILLFSAYILWAVSSYTIQIDQEVSSFPFPAKFKSTFAMEIFGLRLGSIGLFCLAFLFLPVARGSILLRLIDIPFEHATRYHVWLGHLTMALFTLHGLCYVVAWAMQGRLIEQMLEWKNIGIANLPGVISLLAGLLMWLTSLHPVRKQFFELFFYTHQLYVVFIIFLALHVGDFIFSMAAGAIYIFVLDRFLRFCQSRTTVNIISASCLPCGTVELVLSKPKNMRYNALSFIFLQVRELSWLQWHPFSVSSSPLEGNHHISILIKVLGEWTKKLREIITTTSEAKEHHKGVPIQPCTRITASAEGPYGHESAYHLTYENLILVAGGIGISPFLAILSDILHRIRDKKPCLPKNVLVIWAVKKSTEISLLSVVNALSICPTFADRLDLDVQIYVTQESEPPLEEGTTYKSFWCSTIPVPSGSSMSNLVGTGHNIWSGAYVLLSTVGFIILLGLLEVFYIRRFQISSWWFQGLLFTICMVASVVVFGGLVIALWDRWEKGVSRIDDFAKNNNRCDSAECTTPRIPTDECQANLISASTIEYGHRPNFQGIFDSISERWGHVDVGVMVCGPPSLQSCVASECRSQNVRGRWNHPIFHFNSHSFDL